MLNDGHSIDHNRRENFHRSFSQAPRFLLYREMEKRTSSNVGPGSYKVSEAVQKLKSKPCMARLTQTHIKNEDCYEMVNNLRVMQPRYLRPPERKVFESKVAQIRSNKLLKRLNETFIHQKLLNNQEATEYQMRQHAQSAERLGFNQSKSPGSRNDGLDEGRDSVAAVDYRVMERPKTQQMFTRKQRGRQFDGDLPKTQLQTIDVQGTDTQYLGHSMQSQYALMKEGVGPKSVAAKSTHNHTASLIDRHTLGSTDDLPPTSTHHLSSTQNHLRSTKRNGSIVSGITSLKSKVEEYAWGLPFRKSKSNYPKFSNTILHNRKKQVTKKGKKYLKEMLNTNYFLENTRVQKYDMQRDSKLYAKMKEPSLDGVEVVLNPNHM